MSKWKFKIELYQHLSNIRGQIMQEAAKIPGEIGFPDELRGNVGLSGQISECHGLLRKEISDAVDSGHRKVVNSGNLDFEVRKLVKEYYGDEYDAVTASTCEALIMVAFETLVTPPMTGRGDNYRARYIAPYERHIHHHGGYGRPFPAKYKDAFSERGVTAGEFGFLGRRLNNLDTVMVPMVGADYSCHGIKYSSCTQLSHVDGKASAEKIEQAASRHESMLTGFTSMGYTNPSYGYSDTDEEGTPILTKEIARLASHYNVPYIIDSAAAIPFHCLDIRKANADLMLFSMDKAAGGTTCGLAIGREESIMPMARSMGVAGPRMGGMISHGKAAYVQADPGKESLMGLIATLRVLLDRRDQFRTNCDAFHGIVADEFGKIDSGLMEGVSVDKDYGSCGVEVNYQDTWKDGRMGWPIFSIEDMYAGTSLPQAAGKAMGVIPCLAYDANIKMSLGLGTTDENGDILEEPTRYAVRAMARFVERMCEMSGIMD